MEKGYQDISCGVVKTLSIIGKKWTLLVLRDLLNGSRRFGELQRSLSGVSPRTLSQRLDELEKHGIIKRKIFKEIPLHVEYSLTSKGESLGDVIQKMREWGEKDIKK